MANIILALCLAVVTVVMAVALAASAWQWERRARRAERIGYLMQQHLAGLGCRVVVEVDAAEQEQLRFVWPDINDFVIEQREEKSDGSRAKTRV